MTQSSLASDHCQPINESMDPINFKWDRYEPKKKSDKIVIILPGISGAAVTDRWTAKTLCNDGFQSLLIRKFGHDQDTEIDWARGERQTVLAVHSLRLLMELYPGRYAMYGTSLGGIYGATLLGQDPRFEAAVLVAAGGDLPSILAYTEEVEPKRYREGLMKRYGVSNQEDVEIELRKHMTLDPLDISVNTKDVKLLMVVNQFDRSVPTMNQRLLWKAWGKPRKIQFALGHIPGIISSQFFFHHYLTRFLTKSMK